MGVDLSTTIGVGFKVSKEELRAYLGPDVEEYGIEELLETRFSKEFDSLLDYEVGGSYMDGDVEYVIALKNRSRSLDAYEDAGVFGLDRAVLSVDETIALKDAAAKLAPGRPAPVGHFVAILIS